MDIYNTNLSNILNNKQIFIFDKIDNKTEEYPIEENKNYDKVIQVSKNQKKVYIHSKYNPIGEAEKFVQSLDIRDRSIILCFGFGLGYHIKEILKKCGEKNIVYIYENDIELFYTAIKNIDYSDIFKDERVHIVVSKDIDSFRVILYENIKWYDSNKIMTAIMPNFKKIYENDVVDFLTIVKNILKGKIIDKNTMFYFAQKWSDCLNKDLKYVLNSYNISNFKNAFKDKPIVIVSAGPSLSKNVELLKRIKGKVLIIAAFTAVKPLKNFGITPDFMVTIDSNQTGIDETTQNVPLVFSTTSNPELLAQHKGKKIFCTAVLENFSLSLFKQYNKPFSSIEMGGSVACVCTDIATTFGASEIILIGQDLAYTDNKAHVEGSVHKKSTKQKKLFAVEDVFGGEVYTDETLYSYILWFEKYAHAMKNYVKIIDATEGGAKIKDTEISSFNDAIKKYCCEEKLCDVNNILDSIYEQGFTFTNDEKQNIMNEYMKSKADLEFFYSKIDDAIELSQKLLKYTKYSTNKKAIDKILEKLNNIDSYIEKMSYCKNLLIFIMQNAFYDMNVDRKPNEDEEMYIAQKNLKFYENQKIALQKLLPTMEIVVNEFKEILSEQGD